MLKYLMTGAVALGLTTAAAIAGGHSNTLDYTTGDKTFQAFVAKPDAASKGTVYIIHDWNGLDDYEQNRAMMLADLGYTAVALDLFGVDAVLDGMDDNRRETGALYGDRAEFRARIDAGVTAARAALGDAPKDVLMGFFFGWGGVVGAGGGGKGLERFGNLHGGLGTPEGQDYSQTKGSV